MHAYKCVCVCVLGEEGSWVLANTALVLAWTAMYLTGYSDYLTGFHEPPSPCYRCHWFEKLSSTVTAIQV